MYRYIVSNSYGRIKEDASFTNSKRNKVEVFKNELYTPKEIEKNEIPEEFYELVDIPSKNTYFSFGARFEVNKE